MALKIKHYVEKLDNGNGFHVGITTSVCQLHGFVDALEDYDTNPITENIKVMINLKVIKPPNNVTLKKLMKWMLETFPEDDFMSIELSNILISTEY